MRSLALMVAVFSVLVACAGEPPASCGALGRVESCACPGGTLGSQECGPLGVWTACVCLPAPDAGADAEDATPPVDGPAVPEAGADAPEATADAPVPLDGPQEAAADAPAHDAPMPDAPPDRVCVSMTAANCCGVACPTPANSVATCEAQRCAAYCAAGFADCDDNRANGCEVDLRANNPAHCGGCGRRCEVIGAEVATCTGGVCGFVCPPGTSNCSAVRRGCGTFVASDPNNCGSCGFVCRVANATAACVNGACSIGACAAGFRDCDGVASNGCEASTATDAANCGACRRSCAIGQQCVAGICCAAGQANCSGACRDTQADAANCGACGRRCGATTICERGVCVPGCSAPLVLCRGECLDVSNDLYNCGACARGCLAATERCADGACVPR